MEGLPVAIYQCHNWQAEGMISAAYQYQKKNKLILCHIWLPW